MEDRAEKQGPSLGQSAEHLGGCSRHVDQHAVAFATYHRLCGRCASGSSAMGVLAILGKVSCGIFLGIGVLFSAVGAAMQSGAHGVSMLLVVGLIMTIGSLIGMAFVQRIGIPKALRRVGPRPFVWQSIRRCA